MIKNTLIIALLLLVIYLYYQKQNNLATFTGSDNPQELQEVKKVNKIFADFCRNEIGGQDINEIRTKLNGRTLSEILEENDDYETKNDELTRKKGELEAEVIMLTNSRKNQIQEKEIIITRLHEEKKDLDKKVKQKAKLLDEEQLENNKLTQQIENLEAQIKELQKSYQDHLKSTKEEMAGWKQEKTNLLNTLQTKEQKIKEMVAWSQGEHNRILELEAKEKAWKTSQEKVELEKKQLVEQLKTTQQELQQIQGIYWKNFKPQSDPFALQTQEEDEKDKN